MDETATNKIKKEINDSARIEMDKFFVHQIMVRRFKKENTASFEKLISIRKSIEEITQEELDQTLLFEHFNIAAMDLLQNKGMQDLLRNGSRESCKDFILENMTEADGIWITSSHVYRDCEFWPELIECLKKSLALVEDIFKETNIFRFYGLYSMTLQVNFDELLRFVGISDDNQLFYANADFYNKPSRWLAFRYDFMLCRTEQVMNYSWFNDLMLSLYCLTQTGGFNRKFFSTNIKLRDDQYVPTYVDGVLSENNIHLSIPYDELPIDIDAAMDLLKSALKSQLIEKKFYRYNASIGDFWSSDFSNKITPAPITNNRGRSETLIFKSDKIFYRFTIGLYMWDLVKENKATVEKAVEYALALIEDLDDVEFEYDTQSNYLAKSYERVAALIKFDSKEGIELSFNLTKKRGVHVK